MTLRCVDRASRSAIVVGLNHRGAALAPLIRKIAAATPVDWMIVPSLSACLGVMARRTPDLVLLPRAAAGGGDSVLALLARCRPDFDGCVVIAGDQAIDVFFDRASHDRDHWLVAPLVQLCAELGWSLS